MPNDAGLSVAAQSGDHRIGVSVKILAERRKQFAGLTLNYCFKVTTCDPKSDCSPRLAERQSPFHRRWRLRVRAAFFAAAERDLAERCLATLLACLDNALFDADRLLSRLSARFVARERFVDGFLRVPRRLFASSRFAWRFVRVFPRRGGGNFTPARRAFDKPIAIACSGDRAPCSPSRMCSISSRTNSPA
jgi:hypothetical protein